MHMRLREKKFKIFFLLKSVFFFMDTLANLFSSIQNAQKRRHSSVSVPFSKTTWDIVHVLYTEGYVEGFQLIEKCSNSRDIEKPSSLFHTNKSICITLKYIQSLPAIRSLIRISSPGKRIYMTVSELKSKKIRQKSSSGICKSNVSGIGTNMNSFAFFLLFTSKYGVLSERDAKRFSVGGEVIARIL